MPSVEFNASEQQGFEQTSNARGSELCKLQTEMVAAPPCAVCWILNHYSASHVLRAQHRTRSSRPPFWFQSKALPQKITAMALACKRFVSAQRPSTSSCPQVKPSVPHVDIVRAAHSLLLSSAACVALVAAPLSAHALPPPSSDPARCSIEALDKFAGEPCAGSVLTASQLPMQAREVMCMQAHIAESHAWWLSTAVQAVTSQAPALDAASMSAIITPPLMRTTSPSMVSSACTSQANTSQANTSQQQRAQPLCAYQSPGCTQPARPSNTSTSTSAIRLHRGSSPVHSPHTHSSSTCPCSNPQARHVHHC
jgi:hypothetical protein